MQYCNIDLDQHLVEVMNQSRLIANQTHATRIINKPIVTKKTALEIMYTNIV